VCKPKSIHTLVAYILFEENIWTYQRENSRRLEIKLLFPLRSVNKMIGSRKIRWAVLVACIGNTEFYSENLKGRVDLGDLGIDGSIILKGS
jgi:hypothetical protein